MSINDESYLISDLHINHNNIIKFVNDYGGKSRLFSSLKEMNEYIIEKWNSTIKKEDTCYILGDVSFDEKGLKILDNLNGNKCIVLGNHDRMDTKIYLNHVKDVKGVIVKKKLIFTHVPVHPSQFECGRFKLNIHGHLHQRLIKEKSGEIDKRYFNVSCEQLNYTPIKLKDIKQLCEYY